VEIENLQLPFYEKRKRSAARGSNSKSINSHNHGVTRNHWNKLTKREKKEEPKYVRGKRRELPRGKKKELHGNVTKVI